ncbi:MAG: Rnf-Nqr domain containing protein [Oscillospiraceae bacterium]|nr:Rnf-Nqr domain containing protein [Oscillospiraceae bacterium]
MNERKKARVRYCANNMERLTQRDRIFLNNPVMIQGLGLAPIVIAATTMKNATILAVAVILLLTPTRVIAALLTRGTYFRFRGLTYSLVAATLYIGVGWVCIALFGQDIQAVGLYLPLLVVEPIIIKRHERNQKEHVRTAFKKGIFTTIGFLLVLFFVAGARELMAFGTLYGKTVLTVIAVPVAQYASGGFIILGLLAALWRFATNAFKKNINIKMKKIEAEGQQK